MTFIFFTFLPFLRSCFGMSTNCHVKMMRIIDEQTGEQADE